MQANNDSRLLEKAIDPFKSYHIVLWLDGRVERRNDAEFDKIRDEQQNEAEIEWLRENFLRKQPQMPLEPDIF